MTDGLKNKIGHDNTMVVPLRSEQHIGTPEFKIGPRSKPHQVNLYARIPKGNYKAELVVPHGMDPETVQFQLIAVRMQIDPPPGVNIQLQIIESSRGVGNFAHNRRSIWTRGGPWGNCLGMRASLQPLYPDDWIRIFGWSKWSWSQKMIKGVTQSPTSMITYPLRMDLVFGLSWLPRSNALQTETEIIERGRTIDDPANPQALRQENHTLSAQNTRWARPRQKAAPKVEVESNFEMPTPQKPGKETPTITAPTFEIPIFKKK